MQYSDRQVVNLFHILAVAPILAYTGIKGCKADPKVFQVLTVIAVVVVIYHGYLFISRVEKEQYTSITNTDYARNYSKPKPKLNQKNVLKPKVIQKKFFK